MSRHKTAEQRQQDEQNREHLRILRERRVVCIDYKSPKGNRAVHRIVPVNFRFDVNYYHHSPQWLMRAYSIGEQKDRTYALQQVHRWWSEYLTPDDAPIDTRAVSQDARQAFRAAWFINAPIATKDQVYLQACEQRDWESYLESQGRSKND